MRPWFVCFLASWLWLGLGSSEGQACHVARQVRVLPLGVVEGELWVLELDQHRDGDTESMSSVRWTVEPAIVAVSSSGRTVIERRKVLKADDESLDRRIQSLYRRVLEAVRRQGASPLEIVRDVDCRFLPRCEGLSFEAERGRLAADGGGVRVVERPSQLDADLWQGARWGLGWMRIYASNGRQWLVLSIGTGWDLDPCEHSNDPRCTDDRVPIVRDVPPLESSYTRIETLHHGSHADLVLELQSYTDDPLDGTL